MKICTIKHDTIWCFWMCRCSDHLLPFHCSSLLPASIFCGIWHSDYTSVQSFCAPLSIFLLSLLSLTGLPDLLLPLVSSDKFCSVLIRSWPAVLSINLQPVASVNRGRPHPEKCLWKTLFHPVLLSLSLLFLVSYEHFTLRSLVALSFLTVLIRSMPQEGIYPIFTLIWNSSLISFHFTVRSSSTLCVTHNPLFGLTPFSSHHVWLQIPRGHLDVLEITFLFMVLDNPPPSLRDRHPPPPPSSPLPECG